MYRPNVNGGLDMLVPGLYQFFRRQLQHGFHAHGIAEPATVDYVSEVLTRFSRTPALYMVRDRDGLPVEHIAGLMAEWRRAQGWDDAQEDRGREALVVRHIGEYSLFMSGLFRERLKARGQLKYYLSHGRSAFWHCAYQEINPNRAKMFRGLYSNFERVAGALNYIREERLPLPQTDSAAPSALNALWRR